MPNNRDASHLTRRDFLVAGGCVAATGSLVIRKTLSATLIPGIPPASVTHAITMDVTQGSKIVYTAPGVSDATDLMVKTTDVVTWQVKSSGGVAKNQKHHLAVIFMDTPFVDKTSGNPVYAFQGNESEEPVGGNAWISTSAYGSYEYYVGVWDKKTGATYPDDPSMIVGTGLERLEAVLGKLRAADRLLKRAGAMQSPKSQEIQSIETNLNTIIDSLRPLSK